MRKYVLGTICGALIGAAGLLVAPRFIPLAHAQTDCSWTSAIACRAITGGFACDGISIPMPDTTWQALGSGNEIQMKWENNDPKLVVASH